MSELERLGRELGVFTCRKCGQQYFGRSESVEPGVCLRCNPNEKPATDAGESRGVR